MKQFARDALKTAQTHPKKIAIAAYLFGVAQCASKNGEQCFIEDNSTVQAAALFMAATVIITASKSTVVGRMYNHIEHAATKATEVTTSAAKRVASLFRKTSATEEAEATTPELTGELKKA